MGELDFAGLAGVLLARWEQFLPTWVPGGKLIGREYTAGSVRGGPGNSFSFNTQKGYWADFATDERGGDMIALYAANQNISNGEAAKRLADLINYNLSDAPYRKYEPKQIATEYKIGKPPPMLDAPLMLHVQFGKPSDAWCYRDREGNPIFWEARYDTPTGKQIIPWSYDQNSGRWVRSGYPAPRPIYNLDLLEKRPAAPVIVVEGPKCARAAQELVGDIYVPVTWNGGAQAASKTDWAPLNGRKVLIWPDADRKVARTEREAESYEVEIGQVLPYDRQPGIKVARQIADLLCSICPEVKILDVGIDTDRLDGWDAADALAQGWTWNEFKQWARPIAKTWVSAQAVAVAEEEPEIVSTGNGKHPAVAVAQAAVVVDPSGESEPARALQAKLDELGLAVNKRGNPNCNIDNVVRVFENSELVKGLVWFDTFHQKLYTQWNGPRREWSDNDTLEMTKYLQRELGLISVSDNTTFQGVQLYGSNHSRNEPRDWMDTLVWDQTERIETFFIDYLGAKDTEYIRATSKNFWIGMVARIFQPGCKMDNMVVLEGPQGTLKSTALHRIGGSWFTETNESVANKDFFLILQGNLLVEIAELHTFSRAEVTRIKQVITCKVDRYRAPYERLVSDHPRQSIFVGSTNEDTYLKDTTGNRRFWPVKCGLILPDAITASREQLFAEAVAKYKSGATWWEMPKDETVFEQEERRQSDAWEPMISEWAHFSGRAEFTISDVLKECLQVEPGRMDRQNQARVAGILKQMGYETRREWVHGWQKRYWYKPGLDQEIERSAFALVPDEPPNEMINDDNSENG